MNTETEIVDVEVPQVEDVAIEDLSEVGAGNCFGTMGCAGCPACFGTYGSFT